MFNRCHPFENQFVSKVASKEAREAVYRQVGIETASTSRREMEQSQVKPLTVGTPTGVAEQMELGSPMTKMRRVMMPQKATPGVSGEHSQTERKGLINLTNSSDEDMVDDASRVHPVKVKTEELDDDDIFIGLTDHDKDRRDDDDDVFPGPIELPDSDDSDFGDEEDHDLDQIKMQYIYDQQQRNRNTGEVSEIMLMQMKTEIEGTKDMGDQGTHQTSLETEESFTPLSTGDTEEQLTIPSGEDTEASMVQQSEEVQGKEAKDLQQAAETAGHDKGKSFRKTKSCQTADPAV